MYAEAAFPYEQTTMKMKFDDRKRSLAGKAPKTNIKNASGDRPLRLESGRMSGKNHL